jgi:hypothetical protein
MILNDKEIVIKKSRANHMKLLEGVGGKLILTNRRLVFKSHFFNIQTHEESIPLKDILLIEAKHSDFVSGKMSIHLKKGGIETFYVPHRKSWVKDIQQAVEKISGDKVASILSPR